MEKESFRDKCQQAADDLELVVQKHFSNLKNDLIIKTVKDLPERQRHDAIQRLNAAWGSIDDAIRLLKFEE